MTADRGKPAAQDPIVVTGVGLVTPVGHDRVSAVAAINAGIVRFRRIPKFMTKSGAGAAGASAYGLTDERSGSDRLLAMANPALQEALFEAEEFCEEIDLSRSRLLLCLGPTERPRYEDFDPDDLQTLLEVSDAQPLVGSAEIISDGHAGGALAFQRAVQLLRDGTADSCVVGGVDSLVEYPALNWLNGAQRLRTDDHPDGCVPGEAAAFLVVELASTARARGARALAELLVVTFRHEEAHVFSGAPLQGVGLTEALSESIASLGSPPAGLLCDANGEYWRMKDWSLAMTRVFRGAAAVPPLWQPAQSIGDVGSAAIPVLSALAVGALEHGYLPGARLLTWASSDSGGRGTVSMGAPSTAGARA
jgi:3-oxoacyl-[acyl-carrier-protein] synthase-1